MNSAASIKMPPAETVHPILKHPREEGSPSKASVAKVGSVGNQKSDNSRHLTWDEHAIEEHDLLRGTRMKVRLLNITIGTNKCVWSSPIIFKLTYLMLTSFANTLPFFMFKK
jgi:hypothetical protein